MSGANTGELSILDGSTFFVSNLLGDAFGSRTQGLFFRDTRFLSVFRIEVDGLSLRVLGVHEVDYYSAAFFLARELPEAASDSDLSIVRHRFVGEGMHEDLILTNYSAEPLTVRVNMEFASDYADLFEVRQGKISKKGELGSSVRGQSLILAYDREDMRLRTMISFTQPAELAPGRASFEAVIEPRGQWKTCVIVSLVDGKRKIKPKYGCDSFGKPLPQMKESLAAWQENAPALESNWDALNRTYQRSVIDLAALRFEVEPGDEERPLAAGLPWFMALFGRDSMITSYQSMILGPRLAESSLRSLACRQAVEYDDFHDSEPGKMLHELRFGELSRFGETPHSPYYGSIDSTILFLIVLHEAYLWSGDLTLMRELEKEARAALVWIDKYGDLDGDGYVEYKSRSSQGLVNQHWKDSRNSVQFADGRLAGAPIASAEVQGYVYDAWTRLAGVVEEAWGDAELARSLLGKAAALKTRFNDDFWVDEGGYYALALDGDKQRVDSVTSNMGQLLWTGIVEHKRAKTVAVRLMEPAMWSGWGIRTMSAASAGYSPIEYHNGTIWPHDNSLIAAGLVRYGFKVEAARIFAAQIEASGYFGNRLPETFAGYDRRETVFPVDYPVACIPQAWAAGAPLLFLRAILGLEPDPIRREISVKPLLPPALKHLWLKGVHAFGRRFDVEAHAESSDVVEE
ncbi:MAG: amylo-alpha-1,6-glucosidase [Thermoleophilia bacterium]